MLRLFLKFDLKKSIFIQINLKFWNVINFVFKKFCVVVIKNRLPEKSTTSLSHFYSLTVRAVRLLGFGWG